MLIPSISEWLKSGRADTGTHETTQVMSGHGCFGTYLKKIKKKQDNDECKFCQDVDIPHLDIDIYANNNTTAA